MVVMVVSEVDSVEAALEAMEEVVMVALEEVATEALVEAAVEAMEEAAVAEKLMKPNCNIWEL